jgi:hypothetical protein
MFSIFKRKDNIGTEATEPQIVYLNEPIKIIGLSIDTNMKSVYRDVPKIGIQFNKLKRHLKFLIKASPGDLQQ